MSNEEHYFENLLYHGHDVKRNPNKNGLSKEVQEAIEMCAQYVLYSLYCGHEHFLDEHEYDKQRREEYKRSWKWFSDMEEE